MQNLSISISLKDFLIEEGRFRELIRFFKIRACIGNDETTVVGHLANDKFNLTSPSGREFKRRFIRFHGFPQSWIRRW